MKTKLKLFISSIMLTLVVNNSFAAAPNAGAIIGNQATASYTDGSGTIKTSTSNLVETSIEQVAGVLVQDNQSKSAPVGGTIYFQHTIINTGNGSDTYNLQVEDQNTGNITFSNLVIYPDVNQDGVPDNSTSISVTPNLNRGESYGVVIAATISGTSTSGQIETLQIKATSNFDNTVFDDDIDSITVTNNAVINVTKSFSENSGSSPSVTPITVTFTYTNVGDKSANSFEIKDILPAGMSYVANSASWSGLNGVVLTDTDDGQEGTGGVEYDVNGNTITAVITSVAPGNSGQLKFKVTIDSGVIPGNLNNIGVISYEDGNGGNIGPENTNTATYNVLQTGLVVLTDNGSSTDEDLIVNDIVKINTPANQGSSVIFENVVVNEGNGSDIFELTVDQNNFPAGSLVQFLKTDGVTVLTDTNGNSNPDTSLLASGGIFKFKVKVTLPSNIYGDNFGNGFSLIVKATSVFDNTKFDTVTDLLAEIIQSSVDITNNLSVNSGATSTDGLGKGPEGSPLLVKSTLPGNKVIFNMFANNTSAISDTYSLQVSTDPTFATNSIPTGWNVVFKDNSDVTMTSTGSIIAGSFKEFKAEINVPATQAPGQISVYFRLISSTTGASDIIHNAIEIQTVADISINPSNNGQVFSGGTVTYTHTITNKGNKSPENTGDIVVTNSANGWTSVIYWDQNNNSIIDSGESIISNIADVGGLNPNNSIQIIVKVFSPAGLDDSDTNTTTITITNVIGETNVSNNVVTDASVIISGDIILVKYQSLDANCDGVEDSSFVQTSQVAKPSECIIYQVVATNTGTAIVSDLEINDATPPYTTYFDCSGSCPVVTTGTITNIPLNGSEGLITVNKTNLNPLSSIEIKFVVKIDE